VTGRAPELAERFTRGWASLYTRGLHADLRAARRDELESDLWEHTHWSTAEGHRPGRIALEITERLVAGMAADLLWRFEHRGARRHTTRPLGGGEMARLMKNYGMVVLTLALGVFTISISIGVMAFDGGRRWQGAILFVAGLLMLGGLIAVRNGLRGGRPAVALGAIVPGLLGVWTVILPIVTLAILIWLYAPSQLRREPLRPA
jgi:hypothetical protein